MADVPLPTSSRPFGDAPATAGTYEGTRGKLTGAMRFASDVNLPGMLIAKPLVCGRPHARIVALDTARAGSLPGVHAVLTARDIGRRRFGRSVLDRPVLAWDRVRFVGDRVAVVAAETDELAVEALEAVEVRYEDLPAVFDAAQAFEPGAPLLHEQPDEYIFLRGQGRTPTGANVQGEVVEAHGDRDLDEVLRNASRVFTSRYTTGAQHHAYLETHSALVWVAEDGRVHVVTTNKDPAVFRQQFAAVTGERPDNVVVHAGSIGGDFGGKGYSVDEYLCYFLARATGRPVKSQMDYRDEFTSASIRHPASVVVQSALDGQDRIVGTSVDMVIDGGAYAGAKPRPDLVVGRGLHALASYDLPAVRSRIVAAYTNNPPGGHMRTPGGVQLQFAIESHISEIAHALDVDALAFRLEHAVQEDAGRVAINGKYLDIRSHAVLTRLAEVQEDHEPCPPGAGRGVAVNVHTVGGAGASCTITMRLRTDGVVEIGTGLPDQGGGIDAVLCKVAAATLSLEEARFEVQRYPYLVIDGEKGAGASRVTHLGSRAVEQAAHDFRDELFERLRRRHPGTSELRLQHDRVSFIQKAEHAHITIEDLARDVGVERPIESTATYQAQPGPPSVSAAALSVDVSVDPETCQLEVLDAVLVVDVGTVLNETAHEGQLRGGFAFGLGAALTEELRIEDGVVQTADLSGYRVPARSDVPPLRIVLVPGGRGPGAFGAKAVGELVNPLVPPAIANAVEDATGLRVRSLPLTPAKIWHARSARPSVVDR